MNREAMVNRLTHNYGGYNYGGIGQVLMDAVTSHTKPDLPSTVFISVHTDPYQGGPPSPGADPLFDYTDEELAKIVAFADVKDAAYDRMFTVKRGCNPIIIDKVRIYTGDVKWVVKRGTWESGYPAHDSIDEALAWMTEKL